MVFTDQHVYREAGQADLMHHPLPPQTHNIMSHQQSVCNNKKQHVCESYMHQTNDSMRADGRSSVVFTVGVITHRLFDFIRTTVTLTAFVYRLLKYRCWTSFL